MATEAERLARVLEPLIELLKTFSRTVREVADFEESEGKRLDQVLNELLAPQRMVELRRGCPPTSSGPSSRRP